MTYDSYIYLAVGLIFWSGVVAIAMALAGAVSVSDVPVDFIRRRDQRNKILKAFWTNDLKNPETAKSITEALENIDK